MKKTARDNFRKSARENSKVPVTLFEKNVSRALWGVTGEKKNTAHTHTQVKEKLSSAFFFFYLRIYLIFFSQVLKYFDF